MEGERLQEHWSSGLSVLIAGLSPLLYPLKTASDENK